MFFLCKILFILKVYTEILFLNQFNIFKAYVFVPKRSIGSLTLKFLFSKFQLFQLIFNILLLLNLYITLIDIKNID